MQCHCSVLHNSVVTSTSSRIRLRFVVEGMRPDQVTIVIFVTIVSWWQSHHIMWNHNHYVVESMRPDLVTCHNCVTIAKSSRHAKYQSLFCWGQKTWPVTRSQSLLCLVESFHNHIDDVQFQFTIMSLTWCHIIRSCHVTIIESVQTRHF